MNLPMENEPVKTGTNSGTALITVKLLHTAVWAFFVGCIVVAAVAAALLRYT